MCPTTNIPPSIPSKRLALPLTAAGTTLVLNNIEDHLGTDLTSVDVPELLYATLYDDAKTKFEIIEIDGTTIGTGATTGLTINKRGLSFDGGTTAAAETAQDWSAGDTVVQLGTNPSQYYMFLAGTQTITGAKTFSGAVTFSSGITVSSSLEVTGAITGSSSLAITGNADFSSGVDVTGTIIGSSGLQITGATVLSSTLGVTGKGTFSSAVDITGTLACSSGVTIINAGIDSALDITQSGVAGTTSAVVITNASSGDALLINQTGTGKGIKIDSAGGDVALKVNQTNTTGAYIIGDFVSCSAPVAGSTLLRLLYNGAFGQDSNGLQIQKNSAAEVVYLGYKNTDSSGTNQFYRNYDSTNTAGPLVNINNANAGDDQDSLKITNAGAGKALDITQSNSSGSTSVVLITNASTGHGIKIDQNGASNGILIDSESTSQPGISITGTYGGRFEQDLGDGYGITVTRDIAEAGTYPLVRIINDNTNDTAGAMSIQNDGTGDGLYINQTGIGYPIHTVSTATGVAQHVFAVHSSSIFSNRPDIELHRTRGTPTVPTAVIDTDIIGQYRFLGHNGSSSVNLGSIAVQVQGTVSTTSIPALMYFQTNSSGALEDTPKMILTPNGNLQVGSTSLSSGVGALVLGNGTAPTAVTANTVQVYSADTSTSATTLAMYTEFTPEAISSSTLTYKHKIRINGTEFWMLLSTCA